jgi:hypothetical protein
MIELGLLLRLEAPDSATHLNPGTLRIDHADGGIRLLEVELAVLLLHQRRAAHGAGCNESNEQHDDHRSRRCE